MSSEHRKRHNKYCRFKDPVTQTHAAQEMAHTLLPLLELAAFLTVPNTGANISTAETVLDILVCSLLLVQPLNPPCIC